MLPERVTAERYKLVDPSSSWFKRMLYPIVLDHQARYRHVGKSQNGSPDIIIDAASGSGWGTHHLAQATAARLVIGLDFDPEAIHEAQVNFSHARVLFQKADLLKKESLESVRRADVLVSFETLEHFPKELAGQVLENLKSLLYDDAILFISSPNGPLFSPYSLIEGRPWYAYHQHEYEVDELEKFLESSGLVVEQMFGQRFVDADKYLTLASLLYPLRQFALAKDLPWDHRLSRLPLSLLHRFAALTSNEVLQPLGTNGSDRQPLFITAVCRIR